MAVGLLAVAHTPLAAAPHDSTVGQPNLATSPHLGYGIHIAPWTEVDLQVITGLGVDWLKIYNPDQAQRFPNQRLLYRIDVRGVPPNIRGSYENDMMLLAEQLSRQGVEAVEIGNEPNLGPEWGDHPPNAAEYVSVLQVAYRAFKAAAPHITVVSAGLAPTSGTADGMNTDDLIYAQQMFDAGAANYFDVFGYHPYGFDQAPEVSPNIKPFSFRRTELMRQLLLRNGVSKPMWLTEFGWMRDPSQYGHDCTGQGDFDFFAWSAHSDANQAAYIARAYQFADANWPWVGPMFLWNLDWNVEGNSQLGGCSNLRLFSILQSNGQPFPAYYAYQDMPKRYVNYGSPAVSAIINAADAEEGGHINGMARTTQAGCAGLLRLGSFTVINYGSSQDLVVEIEAVNGPGVPRTWTSATPVPAWGQPARSRTRASHHAYCSRLVAGTLPDRPPMYPQLRWLSSQNDDYR
jgi:hypothetical protein